MHDIAHLYTGTGRDVPYDILNDIGADPPPPPRGSRGFVERVGEILVVEGAAE